MAVTVTAIAQIIAIANNGINQYPIVLANNITPTIGPAIKAHQMLANNPISNPKPNVLNNVLIAFISYSSGLDTSGIGT